MLDTIQAKVGIISHKVKEVIKLFNPLVSRGIPFFWEEKWPLLSQKEYLDKLVNCRSDHNKFEDMQQALSGRVVFDKLAEEFELLFDFKVSCSKVPNFSYTYNMEWHRNICKTPTYGSVILIKENVWIHNSSKSEGFQPSLHQKYEYLYNCSLSWLIKLTS